MKSLDVVCLRKIGAMAEAWAPRMIMNSICINQIQKGYARAHHQYDLLTRVNFSIP